MWKRGQHQTEEHKKKISLANTGKRHTDTTKMKMSKSKRGKSNGRDGAKHTEETKSKMRAAAHARKEKYGYIVHPETIIKSALARLGTRMSEETKRKKSISQKGVRGSNWRGGKTDESKIIRGGYKYRNWRTSVFERDNYTCVICNQRGKKLNADHIKPFCAFPELRFDINNGRTLCHHCHKQTDTYGSNAKKWINEFESLISNK